MRRVFCTWIVEAWNPSLLSVSLAGCFILLPWCNQDLSEPGKIFCQWYPMIWFLRGCLIGSQVWSPRQYPYHLALYRGDWSIPIPCSTIPEFPSPGLESFLSVSDGFVLFAGFVILRPLNNIVLDNAYSNHICPLGVSHMRYSAPLRVIGALMGLSHNRCPNASRTLTFTVVPLTEVISYGPSTNGTSLCSNPLCCMRSCLMKTRNLKGVASCLVKPFCWNAFGISSALGAYDRL